MSLKMIKPQRHQAYLRMALNGPPQSGKSTTGSRFANELARIENTQVGVIESEHKKLHFLIGDVHDGHEIDFDSVIHLEDDYSPAVYTEAINMFAQTGRHGVLLIDSLSHGWNGKGGALELVDKLTKTNKFTEGWKTVSPIQNDLIAAILSYPGHVIVTMRTKNEYVMEETTNSQGKSVIAPKKIGLHPIQRDGIEYEFDVNGSIDVDHVMKITGTRCSSIDGKSFLKPGADFIKEVMAWLKNGEKFEAESIRINYATDDQINLILQTATDKGLSSDQLRTKIAKTYKVTEIRQMTQIQAAEFLKKTLGVGVAKAGGTKPLPTPTIADSAQPAAATGGGGERQQSGFQELVGQLQTELDTQPVNKAAVARLNRLKTRLLKEKAEDGHTEATWLTALQKRNPEAKTVADLTQTQAEELEAKIESIFNPIPNVETYDPAGSVEPIESDESSEST